MNSIPSTGAGKDAPVTPGKTVRLRFAGDPDLLNVSRSTVYGLRDDPDFRRMVPIFYIGNVPFVFVADIEAFKIFKRKQALATGKRKIGRPRRNPLIAAE
jgi:hypothetical protein